MNDDWILLSDPDITAAEMAAVADVLQSPHITGGPMVARFEAAFARYVGRRHAIAVPSGTIGMMLAMRAAGIVQAGLPGQIGVTSDDGVKVAFVDFAPYSNTNDLLNFAAAAQLIRQAHRLAALVVVYMHAGAEGTDADHVTRATEYYVGENRGNAYAFAHAAIDDGADLVIASGPHVLRGMQWYKGRLIAYSLGDFANYDAFASSGDLSLSAVLHVTMTSQGRIESASVVPITIHSGGQAFVDPTHATWAFMNQLSSEDFGASAALIAAAGAVRVPPGA